MAKTNKIKTPFDDKIFYTVSYAILFFVITVILYPLIYVVSASMSSADAVASGRVVFLPVDISFDGYKAVFEHKDVFRGYGNSIFYGVVGTLINVSLTMITAYPLARKNLPYKKGIMMLFTFTMLFSGGMIPSYILLKNLKMINTIYAILIPGAISVYNVIVTRTFIQNIPNDILEAAHIDGCSDFRMFFKIILPLSKSVMAVITLYYFVAHWNAYFNAFIYLNDRELYPLQVILREILLMNEIDQSLITDSEAMMAMESRAEQLKYALIIVSSLPVIIAYPFVQKFFVKGVMVGSVKG